MILIMDDISTMEDVRRCVEFHQTGIIRGRLGQAKQARATIQRIEVPESWTFDQVADLLTEAFKGSPD